MVNRQLETTPSGFRPAPWYPVFLWGLLVLLAGSFYLLNSHDNPEKREDFDYAVQAPMASTELVLVGRYCMGVKSIYSGIHSLEPDTLSAELLKQIKSAIRLEADQVGAIPFIAELADQNTLLQHIDQLRNAAWLSPALKSDLDQFEMLYQSGGDSLSQAVQSRLIKRYRWIAQMALTFGLPPDHPQREAAMNPARRTVFAFLFAFGTVCVAGFSGLILFVVFLVLFIKKRCRFSFGREHASDCFKPHVFLETTVVFLALALLVNWVGRYVTTLLFWTIYTLAAIISILWPLWRGIPFGTMRRAFGWHKGQGFFRETGAGLIGYLAGLPLVVCGGIATFIIVKYTGTNPVHPIVYRFEGAALKDIIGLVALASIMAPVIEETIFRGALYRHMRVRHSALLSTLTTGLMFAVVHPQGLAALPALGAIGAVFAILREWRDSLIAPVMAHAFNNLLITMVLAFALMGQG